MIEFIQNNYEWFFSWLGVLVVTIIYNVFFISNNWINQKIKSWKKSNNTQIGNINKK